LIVTAFRERASFGWLIFCALPAMCGCWSRSSPEVVVYSALDREFSEPILQEFELATNIRVRDKYDPESTKTVGLVSEIIQQQTRPACDVFWNNEILHTLRLQKLGLLDVYVSPSADSFPANYVSADGTWHGFAARARVLIVNTDLVPPADQPASIEDLADDRWKDKVAIAKPLFGTTATHAAVLFSTWGETKARRFFTDVKRNAQVLSGNKQVATAVARGQVAFGLTDTDDAIIELEEGFPVTIVLPDQKPDQLGALFIPNTLCIIRGGPNPQHARELVDYLLQPQVEARLATGRSAQFPVNPEVEVTSRVMPKTPVKWMDVDFSAAADAWNTAAGFLRDEFAAAQ
jgi:iron(III) transport system substrate-binding protein